MQNKGSSFRGVSEMIKPTITLDRVGIKCISNIPAGYFMGVDTSGHVPYRLAGTPHRLHCSTVGVGVKLKLLDKMAPAIFGRKAGPERMVQQ